MTRPSAISAFDHRDFRWLWFGSVASWVAQWSLLLGRGWLVYDLSSSSFWVGVATFLSMLPFLLAPLGGTLADRYDRQRLLLWSRGGSLAAAAVLALVTATGAVAVWHIVALALVAGMLRAVELPTERALLADVVEEPELMSAVSLSAMAQHGSRIVGPLVAGPLLATAGAQEVFALSALAYLASFACMTKMATRSTGGVTALSAVWANLAAAARYVAATPMVAVIFAVVVAHCSLTMSFDSLLPGFADGELHADSAAFTTMVIGVGAGALAGMLVLIAVGEGAARGRLLLVTAVASGLAAVAMGVSTTLPGAAASAVGMGASQAMFMTITAVLIQSVVPGALQGRVMSLYFMSAGGIMSIANLTLGSLADLWGASPLFWGPGLAFTALVAATFGLVPRLRVVYSRGTLAAPYVAARVETEADGRA